MRSSAPWASSSDERSKRDSLRAGYNCPDYDRERNPLPTARHDRHIFLSGLAPLRLRAVKQRHVQEWLRELITQRATHGSRKGKPLAEQTVRNVLNALSSAFSEAVAAGKATRA
jgi:hypothetical protein